MAPQLLVVLQPNETKQVVVVLKPKNTGTIEQKLKIEVEGIHVSLPVSAVAFENTNKVGEGLKGVEAGELYNLIHKRLLQAAEFH